MKYQVSGVPGCFLGCALPSGVKQASTPGEVTWNDCASCTPMTHSGKHREEKGRALRALTPLLIVVAASTPQIAPFNLRGASLVPARPAAWEHTAPLWEISGEKPSVAQSSVFTALQGTCVLSPQRSRECSKPQMAIYALRAAPSTSQPPLPIMNFLCGISLRPQKLVSALQLGWGLLFVSGGEHWKGLCPVVGS